MTKLLIPILKGGKDATIEVDTDIDLVDETMYALVVTEGLKAILNSRMSKVGAVTKLEGEELVKAHASAMKIATENLAKLRNAELKPKGKSAKSDLPREVQTEARRIAREVVKNEMRKANIKPSHVAAKDITAAADALIASDPSYVAQARTNLESRANITSEIDISTIVHVSPTLVAKAEKAAAAKKSSLSAKQAGLVKPRQKPSAVAQHTTH